MSHLGNQFSHKLEAVVLLMMQSLSAASKIKERFQTLPV